MQKSFVMLLVAACASAAPVIRTSSSAVVNAASYIPIGAAGTGLAQGCYFVIFGSGLGPANIAVATLPFPQNLAGTTVTVTPAKGSPVQAYLYYALDGQVSGILPSN